MNILKTYKDTTSSVRILKCDNLFVKNKLTIIDSKTNTQKIIDNSIQSITNGFKDYGFSKSEFYNNQEIGEMYGTGSTNIINEGMSVCLSVDSTVSVISGMNHSWIFTKINDEWIQNNIYEINNLLFEIYPKNISISKDNNTIAIGSPNDTIDGNASIGSVIILIKSGDTWIQQDRLTGTGYIGSSRQGISTSLSDDGNTLLIGGSFDNGFSGAAWIFKRNNNIWTQIGSKITGNLTVGGFGSKLSLSGDGSVLFIGSVLFSNYIYIYNFVNSLVFKQFIDFTNLVDVIISNDGATLYFKSPTSIVIYIYDNSLDLYVFFKEIISDGFIISISDDEKILAVGNNTKEIVYVYKDIKNLNENSFTSLTGNTTGYTSKFGSNICVSGNGERIIIGAPFYRNNLGACWIFKQ